MSSSVEGRPRSPDGDWPAQAADTIDKVVASLRGKTAEPLVGVARWVVFGLLAAIVGSVALMLLAVAGIRLLDVYLPESIFGTHHVWAAYTIVGGIFTIVGLFLFAKSRPRAEQR